MPWPITTKRFLASDIVHLIGDGGGRFQPHTAHRVEGRIRQPVGGPFARPVEWGEYGTGADIGGCPHTEMGRTAAANGGNQMAFAEAIHLGGGWVYFQEWLGSHFVELRYPPCLGAGLVLGQDPPGR